MTVESQPLACPRCEAVTPADARFCASFGARPHLARVLRAWSETLRAVGRTTESEATLRRALTLFEEMGIKPEAEAVRKSLVGKGQDFAAR